MPFLCFQEMLEALKALSVFFTENSLRTRRNLRGDIERRSLAINEEFAQIFKEVKEVTSCITLKQHCVILKTSVILKPVKASVQCFFFSTEVGGKNFTWG